MWRFDPEDVPLFEALLRQWDRQLDGVPSYVYVDACERVDWFTLSGRRSPTVDLDEKNATRPCSLRTTNENALSSIM